MPYLSFNFKSWILGHGPEKNGAQIKVCLTKLHHEFFTIGLQNPLDKEGTAGYIIN